MANTLSTIDPELRREVRAVGLVYVTDTQPGIRRLRRGKGFGYRDSDGKSISDRDELQRIRALAIPPAYVDVWICANPRGHLQATGRDARRRKQYRYHAHWRELRDHGKFDRVLAFGDALPAVRRRVRRDLALAGLPRDKVLALIVRLLDETLIRIGNESYTRDNHSYGLTTLRTRHVRTERGRLRFAFRGKSGIEREVELSDKRLARIVHSVQQLPGQRLFQYLDDDGQHQPIDSGQVNDYLRDACGDDDFTAKDFRTWGGTVQAAGVLACTHCRRKVASGPAAAHWPRRSGRWPPSSATHRRCAEARTSTPPSSTAGWTAVLPGPCLPALPATHASWNSARCASCAGDCAPRPVAAADRGVVRRPAAQGARGRRPRNDDASNGPGCAISSRAAST